jgi:hypothetical protein
MVETLTRPDQRTDAVARDGTWPTSLEELGGPVREHHDRGVRAPAGDRG